MHLREPRLHRRSDNSIPAKNSFIGEPEDHFLSNNKICFHFGYPDGGEVLNAWKVLITDDDLSNCTPEEVADAVFSYETPNKLMNDASFLAVHGLAYSIVIYNDSSIWNLENNVICIVDCVPIDGTIQLNVSFVNQVDFQARMVELFGINRTNKPLIYATTEFEGYLSDVSVPGCPREDITLFPGDCDLAVYNAQLNTICVVEFKKHTMSGYGSIEYQSFLKYFYKDRKKYEQIAKITRKLGNEFFYNIIYSTKPDELRKVKIEKVSTNLRLLSSAVYTFNSLDELDVIFGNLMR